MKKIMIIASLFLCFGIYTMAQSLTPVGTDSKISFIIKNMGINVDGSLQNLKGSMVFDPKKTSTSYFDMTVDVKTINTGIEKRDNHLKGADFFDAEKYPEIRIKTTKILHKTGDVYFAQATLTMHGVSKSIQFDFIAKSVADGYLFTGGFPVNRLDYGIGKSSVTMGDKVSVSLSVKTKK